MAGSNSRRKSVKPRKMPAPGEDADNRAIAWYLTDTVGLTTQQLGALVGCSPPTIYRIQGGKDPQDSVARHLKSLWLLLGGSSMFGEAVASAELEDRIKIVKRMARMTPAEAIWETGLSAVAQDQLDQIRGTAA